MNKTIAVTGANGFIGTGLVKHLNSVGYNVLALVHKMPENKISGVQYHCYDLSEQPNTALFKNVDALIHLAFSFTRPQKSEQDINLMAAKCLLSLNLKQYIFISSFSASADAVSYYGQCKHELETIFAGHTVIRPGLVVGDGGLFSRLRAQIKNNPFVPLIAGGKQPMQLIVLPDLITAIGKVVINKAAGVFNLAHPAAITYRQMIVLASLPGKRKPTFIPVSALFIRNMIRGARFLGKRNISEDNLDGLLSSRIIDTRPDLFRLEVDLTLTEELMKQVGGNFIN
jgi:nucleoside-diphosphate-sugar epimerase